MAKHGTYKNCERCNKLFYEYPYQKGQRRFCSWDCSNKGTASMQVATKRSWSARLIEDKLPHKWRHNWAYQDWRHKVFRRDGFKCTGCGKDKLIAPIAHHIKSYKEFPELRLDIDNGVTLCRSCHNRHDIGIKSSQY